jgi:hypothetical protein
MDVGRDLRGFKLIAFFVDGSLELTETEAQAADCQRLLKRRRPKQSVEHATNTADLREKHVSGQQRTSLAGIDALSSTGAMRTSRRHTSAFNGM